MAEAHTIIKTLKHYTQVHGKMISNMELESSTLHNYITMASGNKASNMEMDMKRISSITLCTLVNIIKASNKVEEE